MKLLKAKPRNKQTVIIEIDKFIRGVFPKNALRKYSIPVDQYVEIDEQLTARLENDIIFHNWQRFLNWLAYQERSSDESKDYLSRLPLADDLADKLIEKAINVHYIDDQRCAELLIRSLIDNKKSYKEIKGKLFQKKISPDLADPILNDLYDQTTQKRIINELVNQLYNKNIKLEPDKRKKKIVTYLANRGFNYYDINDNYERIENEKEYQS